MRVEYDDAHRPPAPPDAPLPCRTTYVKSGAEAARLDAERTRVNELRREAEAKSAELATPDAP